MGCNSPGEVLQDFDRDGSLDADDCGPDDGTIHPGAADSELVGRRDGRLGIAEVADSVAVLIALVVGPGAVW